MMMLMIISVAGILLGLAIYYVYKIITGKGEFWERMRNEENLQNALSQGEFKSFEILSDNAGEDKKKDGVMGKDHDSSK